MRARARRPGSRAAAGPPRPTARAEREAPPRRRRPPQRPAAAAQSRPRPRRRPRDRSGSGGSDGGGPVYASPSARRLARERGVDLRAGDRERAQGTDHPPRRPGLRRRRADERPRPAVAGAGGGAAAAGLDLPPGRPSTSRSSDRSSASQRTRIQKISAPELARNWVMIPHVTHFDEADITELEALRKHVNEEHASDGVKVTMVAFLVKAFVAALKKFPNFNSSLDGDKLILKHYYNIGFAADTPGGLVVPVIKDADQKGLLEIAASSPSSRAGPRRQARPNDMQGGTFTISSLGGIGGTAFTPIINAPEVAILGVTRSAMKPVWNGEEFVPAADAAAVALLRPPRDRRRARPRGSSPPWSACSPTCAGRCCERRREVRVPDIGDFNDVPVIEILVSAGDEVAVEDPLVTLESDKATMDVPAPSPGRSKSCRSDRRPGVRGQRAVDARVERRRRPGVGARPGASPSEPQPPRRPQPRVAPEPRARRLRHPRPPAAPPATATPRWS